MGAAARIIASVRTRQPVAELNCNRCLQDCAVRCGVQRQSGAYHAALDDPPSLLMAPPSMLLKCPSQVGSSRHLVTHPKASCPFPAHPAPPSSNPSPPSPSPRSASLSLISPSRPVACEDKVSTRGRPNGQSLWPRLSHPDGLEVCKS